MTDQTPPDSGLESQNPVRFLRDQLGISQDDLRKRAGVSRDTVQRLEQGKGVHASNIAKIAAALGVPVSAVRGIAAARMCIEARDAAEVEQWAQQRVREQVARTQGWVPQQNYEQATGSTPQTAAVVPPPGYVQAQPQQPAGTVPAGAVVPPPGAAVAAPAAPARATDESAMYQTLPASYDAASINLAVASIKNWMATDPAVERDGEGQALIDESGLENFIRVWASTATVADPDSWEGVVNQALTVAGLVVDTDSAAN